ncbi:MAG TPA: hypothetical protein VN867_00375 [Candidatus Binataceae bacterium]|nr:hypothetical protein [Candidatus Binataceae bacterium]
MSLYVVDDAIRALAARRHLPNSHLAKWLAMDTGSRAALIEMVEPLKMRTGQIVVAIDLLDEIAIRERATVAAILSRADIRRSCVLDASGPAQAAAFLDALRAIRFPRLKLAIERLSAEVAALRLPAGLRVVLPKNLGSDELMIQLNARTPLEMRNLLDTLAAKKSELVRLAKLIGDDEA